MRAAAPALGGLLVASLTVTGSSRDIGRVQDADLGADGVAAETRLLRVAPFREALSCGPSTGADTGQGLRKLTATDRGDRWKPLLGAREDEAGSAWAASRGVVELRASS